MNTFVVSVCPLDPDSSDFGDVCALYPPFLHQLTMQSSLFEHGRLVLVVVCVARKLCPCPSYSRRRDRIDLGLWRSFYKGGGGVAKPPISSCHVRAVPALCTHAPQGSDKESQINSSRAQRLCCGDLRCLIPGKPTSAGPPDRQPPPPPPPPTHPLNDGPWQSNSRCCFRKFWGHVLLCPFEVPPFVRRHRVWSPLDLGVVFAKGGG